MYQDELNYEVGRLGDAIEPILLAVMGGRVLLLMPGIFLPLRDPGQLAQQGYETTRESSGAATGAARGTMSILAEFVAQLLAARRRGMQRLDDRRFHAAGLHRLQRRIRGAPFRGHALAQQ